MILYDYRCGAGHQFERLAKLSDCEKPVTCTCGRIAERIIVQAPGMNFGHGVASVYHKHNITHTQVNGDASVTALPVSPADQCQCGDCSQHRRRRSVTELAEPGKERYAS